MDSPDGEAFSAASRAVADDRYGGEFDRGFAHLALQLTFPTLELTDEQAEDIISFDRSGDLGVDGGYIDADGQTIYLFQSKSSAAMHEPELHEKIAAFTDSTSKLMSDLWLAKAHTDMRAFANEFRTAIDLGYSVVSASPPSRASRTW